MNERRRYPYVWEWRNHHPSRWGQLCRIIHDRGAGSETVALEFEDGTYLIAPRVAVRWVGGPRP